jgi:hypothetical protein
VLLYSTRCVSLIDRQNTIVLLYSDSETLFPWRETILPHSPLSSWYISWHRCHLECALPLHLPKLMVWLLSVFALASVVLVHTTPVKVKPQDITTLNSTQIAKFAPFTHFASAAYCHPSTTRTWNCGGAFTPLFHLREARPVETMLIQPTAKRSPTFNRSQLEVTEATPNFVGERTATDAISNNAHEPPPPRVCRVLPIVEHSHRRA